MEPGNFVCPYPGCCQQYRIKKTLKRHIEALHSGAKKYQCHYCNKCMSSGQNLREHIYIHTGEQPYVCTQTGCSSRFRQGSQLSAHKRLHRAITAHTSRNSFLELKVNPRQLTDLIEKDPILLGKENDCIMEESNAELLPTIKGENEFQPIGRLF